MFMFAKIDTAGIRNLAPAINQLGGLVFGIVGFSREVYGVTIDRYEIWGLLVN